MSICKILNGKSYYTMQSHTLQVYFTINFIKSQIFKKVIEMYQNNQLDFIDILSILSFFIAIENLNENRAQSEANDVSKANDKQAHYLLDEIKRLFEEQNQMLGEILNRLNA